MNVSLGDLTVLNSLVCEDVRVEISSKFILIGVFSENILLAEIPGQLSVAFYVEAQAQKAGKFDLQIRLAGPGQGFAIIGATVVFDEPGRIVAITGPQMTMNVVEAGILNLDISLDGKDWTNLVSKTVSKGLAAGLTPLLTQSAPSTESTSQS